MARSDILEAAKDEYEAMFELFQIAWPGRNEEWYVADVLARASETPLTPAECVTMKTELAAALS